MTDAAAFSTIGGHIAVTFVNTRPIRNGDRVELLTQFDDLVAWALHIGVIDGVQAAAVSKFRSSKEANHALFHALAIRHQLEDEFEKGAGEVPSSQLLDLLNCVLSNYPGHLKVGLSDGGMNSSFEGPIDRPTHLVAAIARSVADFYSTDLFGRLRQCLGTSCVLWFVDTSRNKSRHWCRMDRCGARAKAGVYYARKKAEPGLT